MRLVIALNASAWQPSKPTGATGPNFQENNMKHHQHTQYPYSAEIKRRLFISKTERRCEAAAGFILAIAIGVGLACLLVAWWSS